jgi:hypothetical protein
MNLFEDSMLHCPTDSSLDGTYVRRCAPDVQRDTPNNSQWLWLLPLNSIVCAKHGTELTGCKFPGQVRVVRTLDCAVGV